MKRITVIYAIALFTMGTIISGCGSATEIFDTVGKVLTDPNGKGVSVSNGEIIQGLKQALEFGVTKGNKSISKVDGFFKNPLIKIPFPDEAIKVANTLRTIGMGGEVDKVVKSLNRAAEDAAKSATPIFVSAVKKMTINDAMGILKGSNDAATSYLKRTTSNPLQAAFSPVIKKSLDKVDATKYWKDAMNIYNALPTTRNKINPNLTEYVTGKAMEGVFHMVSKEEAKIRKDPLARTTNLLKKVFKLQDNATSSNKSASQGSSTSPSKPASQGSSTKRKGTIK